jgi:hypothetical protein
MASTLWGLLLIAGAIWPSRVIGPLDGAPLDQRLEAIEFVLLLPAAWVLHPAFLRRPIARGLVAALALWKIATWVLVAQTGWCGIFLTSYEPWVGSYRLDRSWDARTFWSGTPPACSAIVARRYEMTRDFPGWTVNVPFGSDRDPVAGEDSLPVEHPRPPGGSYAMAVDGFMYPSADGVLSFDVGPDVTIRGAVDGRAIPEARGSASTVSLGRGAHHVTLWLDLRGAGWRFAPTWNGVTVFDAVPTSVAPQTAARVAFAWWGRWLTAGLIGVLLAGWIVDLARSLDVGWGLWAWTAAASAALVVCALRLDGSTVRLVPAMLLGSVVVPVPPRLRTIRSAFLALGVAWIAFHVVRTLPEVGRFWLFGVGDDTLEYQRFAHRVFMEGRWLEGGERVFRWQPLYRWIVGLLHLVFGDSSVGEGYVDAGAILVGSLFAFEVVRRLGRFRPALAACALTLTTFAIAPTWYLIGRGLTDLTAAGFIYCAAFAMLRAREGSAAYAAAAGGLAALAFLTRVNHLPVVLAMVALLLPDDLDAASWWRVTRVWRLVPRRQAAAYLSTLAAGVATLGLRGWYLTGAFHLFGGMGISHGTTGLGSSVGSVVSAEAWRRSLESVLMIVTVQDPPWLDPRSLLVVAGVVVAALALVGVPRARRLPLSLTVFCLSCIVFGFGVRGVAYPGRFSVHLIPVAVAVSVAALAGVPVGSPAGQQNLEGVV